MKKTLLIAEDDDSVLALLRNAFQRTDLTVTTVGNGDEAIRYLESHPADVILTDVRMPGVDGIELLTHARKNYPGTEVVVMTGFASVETAVAAMKLGAFHYVTKPFEVDEVVRLVDKALELCDARRENVQLKSSNRDSKAIKNIIGTSDGVRKVLDLVRKVADTDSTILVTGESGTGKELVARAIHVSSPRVGKLLVPINCSAIPAELLESELFGHTKGSFTGAHAARVGRFEMAHQGTLFLDEIGEMSPNLQAKLLRVLQERLVTPVGGNKAIEVDVRVIAATNKDLDVEVAEGRFRADLFFRLNVIPIRIPPLRERADDIPVLVSHFIERFNREKSRSIDGIAPEAMTALLAYPWPGNIRELENAIERAVVLTGEGTINVDDLPEKVGGASCTQRASAGSGVPALTESGLDIKAAVDDFENALIRQALHLATGNKNKAAGLLGLKRTTFVEMLKRKNIGIPDRQDVDDAEGE